MNSFIKYLEKSKAVIIDPIDNVRPFIKYLKENTTNKLVGAEIGVKRGENAEDILNNLNIEALYLIDPWGAYNIEDATDKEIKVGYTEFITFNKWRKEVFDKFNNNNKVFIHPHTSEMIANLITEKFDFVYIDAIHKYKNILEDCNLWYPNIKLGGYLCGHDWNNEECGDEVQRAVNEFIISKQCDLITLDCDWIIKKI